MYYGVLINPLGTHVYVTNRSSDTVSVIETVTHTVVGVIPTGDHPTGIDLHPAGTRLYVANENSDNVSVLNPSDNSLLTHLPVGDAPVSFGKFIGPAPAPQSTRRLSLGTGGRQGLGEALQAAVSSNGRYVAFASDAANLVGSDTNGVSDIFVRDRVTGVTTRVTRGPGGLQANGASYNPAISDDGRYVAFESDASNLVVGDTNGLIDIFVYDRVTTGTTRVSVATGVAGAQGNGHSVQPSISQDGRFVAFASEATNLVAGDTNGVYDVFVRDRVLNTTIRVSVSSAGVQAVGGDSLQPFIADNGLVVAFISAATNLVAGDTNDMFDVFVRSIGPNTTVRASVSSAGVQANGNSWYPSLNNTGTFIVFASDATNLVNGDSNGVTDIFLRTGVTTSRVSLSTTGQQGDGPSYQPVISNDGRYVAFTSYATLDAIDFNGTGDIYVRDRTTARTFRASVDSRNVEGNSESINPVMSGDGRYILFTSFANNLVSGDTNNAWDIFVRDRGVGTTPAYPLSIKTAPASEDQVLLAP